MKTLADGRIRLDVLTTKPADITKPKLTELQAGKKVSCQILKSDYALGATGDAEITEQEMCKRGEGKAPGQTSYEGSVTPFLYLDAAGKLIIEDNTAWEAFKKKGTTLWLVEREGPEESKPYEAGDIVSIYEVVTNTPTKPSDRFNGYIKRTVKLSVSDAAENVAVVS